MCLALALRDSIASLGLLDDLFGYFPVDERGMGASVVTPVSHLTQTSFTIQSVQYTLGLFTSFLS